MSWQLIGNVAGKDADASVIQELRADITALRAELAAEVAKAMAGLPPPKDGKDGAPGEPGKSVDAYAVEIMVASKVDRAIATLSVPTVDLPDIAELVKASVDEAKLAIPIPKDGCDGTSVTADDVRPLIADEVQKAVAALPPAKDGAPGASVDPAVIDAMVATRVAALPVPKDGHSVTVDDVEPLIAAEVSKAVSHIRLPKDGVGVTGALIDRDGRLVLTLSDGATKEVGSVVGRDVDMAAVTRQIEEAVNALPKPKDGLNGIDGRDGLGFDDIHVEHDGERSFTFKFIQGDRVKTFGAFQVPVQIYRGVYQAGRAYDKGDTVTWAGHMWQATDTTTTKPDDKAANAWILCVQRGKEGKPGLIGPEGPQGRIGPQGPQGRNGY